jgi:hypothetical protein
MLRPKHPMRLASNTSNQQAETEPKQRLHDWQDFGEPWIQWVTELARALCREVEEEPTVWGLETYVPVCMWRIQSA